jgi:hypothetical protein
MSVRLSICLSVCTQQLGYHWTDFYEILYTSIFLKPLIKFKFRENLRRITDTLREDLYTFMIMRRSVPLSMKNVSDKFCRENQNSHFMFSSFFAKLVLFVM